MRKSTKSHLRGLFPPVSATPTNALRALVNSPLLKNTLRVHELVARVMRGECVRYGTKQKWAVLSLSTISTIPRVRTYHTKKPSRFVHALSARPLKVQGGRGYGECADKSKDFRQPSPVGEGVSHRLTDEVLSLIIKKLFSIVLLREHDG